jgi:hypothetical protein
MFSYKVWFKDKIFNTTCSAKGKVNASSRTEATEKVCEFYEEIIHLTISPIVAEEEFEYDSEWEL